MKQYDDLIISNKTTAQAKRILRTLSETRTISIQKLTNILSNSGIDDLNKLSHLDDVQMKQFTKQLAKHGSVDKALKAAAGEVIQQAPELLDLSKTLTNKATDLTRYADTLP
jgi:ribosomal protein S13